MKLIYVCANCKVRNEFDVPKSISNKYDATSVLAGHGGMTLNMWVRHMCSDDVHGIAPLVAIVDD